MPIVVDRIPEFGHEEHVPVNEGWVTVYGPGFGAQRHHYVMNGKALCGTIPDDRLVDYYPDDGETDDDDCPVCRSRMATRYDGLSVDELLGLLLGYVPQASLVEALRKRLMQHG